MIVIDGREEQLLFYDSKENGEDISGRILIFSTKKNLEILSGAKSFFMDGTFSICPQLFHQLYTIHVEYFNEVIPVIYVLLPNKTKQTYAGMLKVIKNICPNVDLKEVLIDFEQAVIKALLEEFPEVEISGCFFHLTQNIWKNTQAHGLQQRYQECHQFALWIRMIPSLAFLPPSDVVNVFEQLIENPDFPQDALPLANYFEDTYIGRLRGRLGRQRPLFSIDMWNMYNRTLQGKSRTNNSVEGWHRGFQLSAGASFPNIYKFINFVKQDILLRNFEIVQLQSGHSGNRKNQKYKNVAVRISNIVSNYQSYENKLDYIKSIAYNFEL